MENRRIFAIVIILVTLIMPVLLTGQAQTTQNLFFKNPNQSSSPSSSGSRYLGTFKLYDSATGTVTEVNAREYIIGTVAAEMPAQYQTEALKAQAVAAYSFAICQKQQAAETADPALHGGEIATDSKTYQGYMTIKEMKEKWGSGFEAYYNRIAQAVDAVAGKIMVSGQEVVVAAYHAISPGKTENSVNIWGGEKSYLVPVESQGDTLAPGYQETVIFSANQLQQAFMQKYSDIQFAGDAGTWLSGAKKSDSGSVLSIKVGNKSLSGMDIRDVLNLRSPSFDIAYQDSNFKFTTFGYGHGVGMSQYGADYMARQGSTWEEILKHYYTGIEIVGVTDQML